MRFSEDSSYFAVSDSLCCISIFSMGHKYDDPS